MTFPTRAHTDRDLSALAEQDLGAWAEQTLAAAKPDTRFVRYGAIAFWAVVAGLLLARVLLVDVTKLRPEASATVTPHSLLQLTPAPKA